MARNSRQATSFSEAQELRFTKMDENLNELSRQVAQLTRLLHTKLSPASEDDELSQVQEGDESSDRPRIRAPTTNRFIKPELPRFDGTNPRGWLFKVEQYVTYYSIPEEQKINMVAMLMDGPALPWFQSLHSILELTTWRQFKEDLMTRFGLSPYRDLPSQPPVLPYRVSSPPSPTYTTPPPTYTPPAQYTYNRQPSINATPPPYSPPALTYPTPTPPAQPTYTRHSPIITTPVQPPPAQQNGPPLPSYRLTPSPMSERKTTELCFKGNGMFHQGYICTATLFLLVATNEDYDEPGIATTSRDSEPIDYG